MSKIIGTNPNQVPTNGDLGTMAYMDVNSFRGPIFSAYSSAGQALANQDSNDPVQYNNISWDTHNCFDTSTYRFTPNKPGYYILMASTRINSATDQEIYDIVIRKNTSTDVGRRSFQQYRYTSAQITLMVEANGIDDYFWVNIYMGASGFNLRTTAIENQFQGYYIGGPLGG